METISYLNGTLGGYVGSNIIGTTETTILIITDMKYANKSQMTAYYDFTLGGATQINIRYYYTPDFGKTWFDMPIKDLTTGFLIDRPSVLNSGSPTKVTEDIAVSSCTGIKVTATSVGATSTINNFWLLFRDN